MMAQSRTVSTWEIIYYGRFINQFVPNIVRSTNKIKENGFELTKKRSRRYPAKTITDADYADDIAILANAPA